MSIEGVITQKAVIAGINISSTITRGATGQISHEIPLPAGKSGTITSSVCTMQGGHGLIDTDTVDVFWATGLRYGVDITNVNVNAVTLDGGTGTGDALPTGATPIVMTKQVVIDTDFDGDLVEMIVISCDERAHFDIQENDDTSILAVEIPTADEYWEWHSDGAVTNPLTGDPVGKIVATNGSTTAATLKIGVIYNSE